jgi:hypothetical protein
MKTIRESEPVAGIMVAPARHAEQVWESQHDVCRWPTMAIRDPFGLEAVAGQHRISTG